MLRNKKKFCAARMVQNLSYTTIAPLKTHKSASGGSTFMRASLLASARNCCMRRQISLWLLRRILWLRVVFHLPGILDKDHRLPNVVIGENAIPAGHGRVT